LLFDTDSDPDSDPEGLLFTAIFETDKSEKDVFYLHNPKKGAIAWRYDES
jgi:hypothetical protein